MSLLMDALKKAELAKRQGGSEDAAGSPEASALSLEPLPSSTPALEATTIPDVQAAISLSSHLEELDARFLEEAAAAARQMPPVSSLHKEDVPPPMPAAPPAMEPAGRNEPVIAPPPRPAPEPQAAAAARNVFAAKQPEKADNRKGFAIAVGVLTVVAVIAIGGYFWWQLQPKSPMLAARPASPPPAAPVAAPTPIAPPVAVSPAPTPGAPATAPAPATTVATPKASVPPQAASRRTQQSRADEAEDEPPPSRARAAAKAPPRPAEISEDDGPVRVTRSPLKVDPSLARGFDALNRGELTLAQLEYERARKNDPRNTDVLHGLATIALRNGRADLAEAYYRQIVDLDPQDPLALAALLNQRGQVDPGGTESRLKSLAAGQPDLAAPQFALGNLYAKQGRWNDAQQAYFRAYNAEPENPDILFNLAVSLEHLRQNKLAAQYYQQAIAAAASRPAGFDRERAAARLKTLQN